MADLKTKILAKFTGPTLSVVATLTPDGKPWARYIMCTMDDNLVLRFATFTQSRKVAQINQNPEVHVTAGVTDLASAKSYVQIAGKAVIKDDSASKEAMWYDELKAYFSGPDDPNYCVGEIVPYHIEFQSMDAMEPEVWEA
ncbi:MAG: pyridoxamine 5'-phosphate oxidase family protein [Deltaproteobacteria bacterium]|nr:pyridoxamine 5'-phosphate oxidase family protein [Deltaproteobacteria bacterium]